jgi:PIN domain nuclease of toxin-antitoxin system
MNYLLDTHTFIWTISEKGKLSAIVKQTIENPSNNIFVSAITFWEISLKFSIGKLDLEGISPESLPEVAVQSGFQLISLPSEESAAHHQLMLTKHKDPFDRMLIWQSIQRNLIFISRDERLENYNLSGLKTLW